MKGESRLAGLRSWPLWVLCIVAAAAGLATSLWIAYPQDQAGPANALGPPVGGPPPTLSHKLSFHRQARASLALRFADRAGMPITLADFRGRMVLLNVWATWCTPCREEMPALDRLQAKLGGPDFEVVALSLDQGDDSVVHRFFSEVGIQQLQIYRDLYRETATAVGLTAVPLTLLLDREGREIARMLGAAAWDHPELIAQLEAQLGRAAGTTPTAPVSTVRGASDLVLHAAWARPTLPGQNAAAVYLTLSSTVAAQLTEIRSDAADTVEIHSMTVDGGVMKMREQRGVPLPAGQVVPLQPGGTHLMMQQLHKPLLAGEKVGLTLRWLDASGRPHVTRVDVPVRATSPSGS